MLGMRQDIPASFSPVSEEAFPQPDAATGQMPSGTSKAIFFQDPFSGVNSLLVSGYLLSFGNSTVHWHKTPIESNNVFAREPC